MNISQYKASWSMFLNSVKQHYDLYSWWNLAVICFIVFGSSSLGDTSTFLFAIVFGYSLAGFLQPALAFHRSSYQLLMPRAKRYVFYHSVFALLTLSLLGSWFFFDSLDMMLLGFMSFAGGGLYVAILNAEWREGTPSPLGYFMLSVVFVLCALYFWFLMQGGHDLNFQYGKWFEKHYLITVASLGVLLSALFFRLYQIANTNVEHNPHLSGGFKRTRTYLSSYKAPTAESGQLVRWLTAAISPTPVSKAIYPEDLSNKSLYLKSVVRFSFLMCILVLFLYYIGDLVELTGLVLYVSAISLAIVYAVFIDELSNKIQLIVYLRLQTTATSRANYMKQVANVVAMRQLITMLFVAAPILLTILILQLGSNDTSPLVLIILTGVSGFFYIMAYTLWYLRMPLLHKLGWLSGLLIPACLLLINWLALSHTFSHKSAVFLLLLATGLALYLVSFNKWMRHEMEWTQ
jgi:hypothetical protein